MVIFIFSLFNMVRNTEDFFFLLLTKERGERGLLFI